jgi:predicted ATP-dependent endonuclease of OLD family
MLGKITIERFKNINEICLELDKVNVLVLWNKSFKFYYLLYNKDCVKEKIVLC